MRPARPTQSSGAQRKEGSLPLPCGTIIAGPVRAVGTTDQSEDFIVLVVHGSMRLYMRLQNTCEVGISVYKQRSSVETNSTMPETTGSSQAIWVIVSGGGHHIYWQAVRQ